MPPEKKHIAISDLVRVHACPVRYYYERDEPFAESDRYAVCKQLSYHLGDPLDAEVIWAEILVVRPKIDPALREFLDISITACHKRPWQPAEETDVQVHSEKQGFAGMIDRILPDGSFSIVRAAGALPSGTYAADRLRVAAIALCLRRDDRPGSERRACGVYPGRGLAVPYRPAPRPAPADHDSL